jgi:membrane protein
LRDTVGAFSEIGVGALITCVVLVLWAGSWVFAVVERAVNRIWGTVSRTFLHGRALTVGMVGLVGLLLSVSVVITSALVALRGLANRFSPRQIERYTLLGSVGSAFWQIVFFIAKYIFAWSLGYFHYDQIYGSVGAVVAVLTWSYVSSLILLLGAQMTAVFHYEHPTS